MTDGNEDGGIDVKSRRYIIYLSIFCVLIITLNCIHKYNIVKSKTELDIQTENIKKISIIFNRYGLGDKSFNDLCYEGLLKSQEKLGIQFDYIESKTGADYEDLCREYAISREYDLIILLGSDQEDALYKVSKEFPNQKFTIVDSKLDLPNVSAINTKWSEHTFLNGVIAGLSMAENKIDEQAVGIVLGKDRKYLLEGAIGFEAGVKYINPDIEVIVGVVDDFSNPAKAKSIALSIYRKGATYIQHIAGGSGLGVFAAAKEVNKYAFGVDGNQNFFEPDYIVATATRHADEIIYKEIKSIVDDTWKPGIHEYGIKENFIGYTREGSNVYLEPQIIEYVEKIKKEIVEDKLKIPSSTKDLEGWINKNRFENSIN